MELRLQLFVVFLQDVHACLQPALVLPQQLGLGQHLGLVGVAKRAVWLPVASGGGPPLAVLLLQLVILPLQSPGRRETRTCNKQPYMMSSQ